MTFGNALTALPYLLSLIILTWGTVKYVWFKTQKQTIDLLIEQNITLRAGNADLLAHNTALQAQNICDNQTRDLRIGKLEGQVEVLSTVPLERIARDTESNVAVNRENAAVNKAIFETLQEILRQSQRVEAALGLSDAATEASRQGVADRLLEHDHVAPPA
jgi:hypothetical protein